MHVCAINGIGKMVSFEPGKEIKKFFFRLVTSVGQKKKIPIPREDMTLST